MKEPSDDVRDHKFKVGQTVYYTTGIGSRRRSDAFKIMQRLPPAFDRVVKESEIEREM